MNKQKLIASLACLTMLTGLAACSNGTTSASTSDSTSSTTGSDTIEITFWHTSGKAVVTYLERDIAKFEALVKENDGVDVNITLAYQGGYDDILSKIEKGFPTGNYPNMAIAYPDHVAEYLDDEGDEPGKYVVDLSQYVNDETVGFGKESWIEDGPASDFIETFYNEGSGYARDGLYSLPLMKSSEALYYNMDIVSKYASSYDSTLNSRAKITDFMNNLTWDQLVDFARYIKTQDSTLTPIMYDSDSNLFITKCYQNDIPYVSIDENHNGVIGFNNDEAKAMVTTLKGLHDEGLLETKGTLGEYTSSYFTDEKCVFDIGSTGGAGYNYPDGDAFEVGVAKVPYDNDNPLYVTQGLTTTVFKKDDPDGKKALYCYKFIKYLTSPKVNAELCVNGSEGYSPVCKSAYETSLYSQYLANEDDDFMPKVANMVYNDIGDKYFYSPCFKGSAAARTNVGNIITQVLMGNATVDDAFETAENQTKLAM